MRLTSCISPCLRVLIPCYTEALDIVKQVVLAAANAPLPDKCRRTVYLLDDGKDAQKADFVAKQGGMHALPLCVIPVLTCNVQPADPWASWPSAVHEAEGPYLILAGALGACRHGGGCYIGHMHKFQLCTICLVISL